LNIQSLILISPMIREVENGIKIAMKEGSVRISEPYNTLVTKQMVISIDKPVLKNNNSIGVISLTISLDNILNKIK
jgi:Cache domain.